MNPRLNKLPNDARRSNPMISGKRTIRAAGMLTASLMLAALTGHQVVMNAGATSERRAESVQLLPRAIFPKPVHVQLSGREVSEAIILKFHEGTRIRLRDGRWVERTGKCAASESRRVRLVLAERDIAREVDRLNRLVASLPGAARDRLFGRPEVELDREKLEGENLSGRELADLNLYYLIQMDGETGERANLIDNLNASPIVEIAYPQGPTG